MKRAWSPLTGAQGLGAFCCALALVVAACGSTSPSAPLNQSLLPKASAHGKGAPPINSAVKDSPFSMADTVSNCDLKGIDRVSGREGTCRAYYRVSGRTRIFTVVDHEHVLRMPDFEVRVLAARQRVIRVSSSSPPGYPHRQGVQTSFALEVRNTTAHVLPFDLRSTDVALGFIVNSTDHGFTVFEERPDHYIRRPWIAQEGPLPAGATRRGWISFITVLSHARFVGDGDLYFFDPGDKYRRHVGEIRLWR